MNQYKFSALEVTLATVSLPANALQAEYSIKLAEKAGLSHRATTMERRTFLRGLLASGALVMAPSGLFVPREPKVHQVPAKLVVSAQEFGLSPIVGQPGLFRDNATGQTINIRDFRDEDRYDAMVFPASEVAPGTEFIFFQDIQGKKLQS